MPVLPITAQTATAVRKKIKRKVKHVDFDDIPKGALEFPSVGDWKWEVTINRKMLVTVRKISISRADSLDDNIVDGDNIFTTYAKSSSPNDIATAVARAYRTKCDEEYAPAESKKVAA